MKLDPGFPDHWKTRELYRHLGAEGILAILRLWGRAQIQRQWNGLDLTPKKLKAVCSFPGDELELWNALTDRDAPWIDQEEGGTFAIHGFEDHQAQVIALWRNGAKGGRPKNAAHPHPHPHPLPLTPYGSQLVRLIEPNANQMVSASNGESRSKQPAKSPKKPKDTDQAEAIYQAYPRKVKKPEALKAIRKAMHTHPPELLLEKVQAFAAAITPWQERQFIPHPATWFNAEQFNDDPEEWKPPTTTRTAKPRPKETADCFGLS